MSESQKKRYEDPKEREKSSNAKKKYYEENPEVIKKQSDRVKKYYKDNPEAREKASIVSKKQWEDLEARKKMSEILNRPDIKAKRSGENNPRWKDGRSFAPYCLKFNIPRRRAVRNFFGRMCLACGKHESENVCGNKQFSLSVHHIDHDKEQGCNGKPFNLIPLCHSCHTKEFFREEDYKKYINKTLDDGFKWGIWNKEEYIEKVMY